MEDIITKKFTSRIFKNVVSFTNIDMERNTYLLFVAYVLMVCFVTMTVSLKARQLLGEGEGEITQVKTINPISYEIYITPVFEKIISEKELPFSVEGPYGHLNVDIKPFSFYGHIKLLFNVTKNTEEIELHADPKSLTIYRQATDVRRSARSQADSYTAMEIRLQSFENGQNIYKIIMQNGSTFSQGQNYILYLSFSGKLNNNPSAFTFYNDPEDEEFSFAVTNFQHESVNTVIPSLGEDLLARYVVHLIIPNNYFAVTNTEIQEIQPWTSLSYQEEIFAESPLMRMNQLAFYVSNYTPTFLQTTTRNNIRMKVYGFEHEENPGTKIRPYLVKYVNEEIIKPIPEIKGHTSRLVFLSSNEYPYETTSYPGITFSKYFEELNES